jgi:hypothetical protein
VYFLEKTDENNILNLYNDLLKKYKWPMRGDKHGG